MDPEMELFWLWLLDLPNMLFSPENRRFFPRSSDTGGEAGTASLFSFGTGSIGDEVPKIDRFRSWEADD
jgi:hypothetical protein